MATVYDLKCLIAINKHCKMCSHSVSCHFTMIVVSVFIMKNVMIK